MTPHNRGAKLPGEILTTDEVRALLRSCNRGPTGARNRALICLLWRAGLRVAEALALRPSDLDLDSGLVRVRRGKGGRPRAAGLDPEACAVVEQWITIRSGLNVSSRGPVLCTLQGEPLDPGYVRAMFKRLGRRAGIKHRVHPHALRHSWAVSALREGASLPEVQAQLGHASLATTSRYLAHVLPDDLAARARSRPSWAA